MKSENFDYPLLVTTLLLTCFGVIMVFSSSYYMAIESGHDKTYFLFRELRWMLVGTLAMIVASMVSYKVYKHMAFLAAFLGVFLLIFVLFFGREINNAQRWIFIGSTGFMPSEIAKIGSIFLYARVLSMYLKRVNEPKILLMLFAGVGLQAILILKQPDMSTAVVLVGLVLMMIFCAGLKWYWITFIAGATIGLGVLAIAVAPYRMNRYYAFKDPFSPEFRHSISYQIVQSLYALGTGGVTGVGPGHSVQNKLYLPEPQNDFILATIGEEFGLMGTVLLLLVFWFLIYRCIKITMNAPDMFSFFIGVGITSMIAIQTIMNYAVATSSMPVTGVTLPFISYGGTSLVVLMGAMGIMLNISKHSIELSSEEK